MEVKCQQCGKYIPAASKFCLNCGLSLGHQSSPAKTSRISCPDGTCTGSIGDGGRCGTCGLRHGEQPQKRCPYCAEVILASAVKCKHCGEFLDAPGTPKRQARRENKNKTVAALLALFLGGIGIHKFYLGKTGQGVVYLLFFWTSIPFFIAFFEGIALLVKDEADFDRQYNY